MTERITPEQFHASDGVRDWRVVFAAACAHFRAGSFAQGLDLVIAIGELAAELDHAPDVDLRSDGVTVSLPAATAGGFAEHDITLAQEISLAARSLGLTPDPSAVKTVQVTIDALVGFEVRPFWRAVLGYQDLGPEDLVDPQGRGPCFWFQEMGAPRDERNRLHIDVAVPHDLAEDRVAAAVAAGGHVVSDTHAPMWWVLADAEGNEACVATWVGRD
ncbi:VOC family protein [Umezawaea sp. NPDC059074]|uniref:VOC family protein n=1 Tax=Umezawaea sp. NPDC059074 TaxID=3346716 RepID=UPI00367734C4